MDFDDLISHSSAVSCIEADQRWADDLEDYDVPFPGSMLERHLDPLERDAHRHR